MSAPFPGVTLVDDGSRAMVVANLCTAGVSVRATRYAERKATPQQWATGVGAQVAVNADFFDFPGWTWVAERARGAGENWPAGSEHHENRAYWQFGPGVADLVQPGSSEPAAGVTEIVGAHNLIIRDGKSLGPGFDGDSVIATSHRRTGVGLNGSRSKLYLFASNDSLDGNQMAAAMFQLAAEAGAPDLDIASNEDGGGSSQMFVAGKGQIIDSGRQVNNHLGLFAKGSGAAPSCWHRPPTQPLPAPAGHCGVVNAGEGLGPRQMVSSCDGRFSLLQQSDGNLVLYGPVGKAMWSTSGQTVDGYALVMQSDGNAVQYSAYGRADWNAGTSGHPGARLVVQPDGNLVVYDGGTALWATLTFGSADMPTSPTQPLPAKPAAACGEIKAGEGLARGQSVVSCDGRFTLTMQDDGNLVLRTLDGKAHWASSTVAAVGYTLTMGPDGNLVVATPYQLSAWSSDTSGHPGARLAVQSDGNLVVYDGSTALWNSQTVLPDAPFPPATGAGGAGGAGAAAGGQVASAGEGQGGLSGASGQAGQGGQPLSGSSGQSGGSAGAGPATGSGAHGGVPAVGVDGAGESGEGCHAGRAAGASGWSAVLLALGGAVARRRRGRVATGILTASRRDAAEGCSWRAPGL